MSVSGMIRSSLFSHARARLANHMPNPKCVFEAIAADVAEWQVTTTLVLPSLDEVQETVAKFGKEVQLPRASAVKRKGAPCSKPGFQARNVVAKPAAKAQWSCSGLLSNYKFVSTTWLWRLAAQTPSWLTFRLSAQYYYNM